MGRDLEVDMAKIPAQIRAEVRLIKAAVSRIDERLERIEKLLERRLKPQSE